MPRPTSPTDGLARHTPCSCAHPREAQAGQAVQDKTRKFVDERSWSQCTPPNPHERVRLQRRLRKISTLQPPVEQVAANLRSLAATTAFHEFPIRSDFVYQNAPNNSDADDRVLPARNERPPATRIISPRGLSLRLYLTALFETYTQSQGRSGYTPLNDRPLRGRAQSIGWSDLVSAPDTSNPNTSIRVSPRSKRVRQIQSALNTLSDSAVQLVHLPNYRRPANRYEGFTLLDEAGARPGDAEIYKTPNGTESTFMVPAWWFTDGWINVLEDTEIAFLLMVAHAQAEVQQEYPGSVIVPSRKRLDSYGIGRDAYEEAHRVLSRVGLASVEPDRMRRVDGKVRGFSHGIQPNLHRLTLARGLRSPGPVSGLGEYLKYQLSRK